MEFELLNGFGKIIKVFLNFGLEVYNALNDFKINMIAATLGIKPWVVDFGLLLIAAIPILRKVVKAQLT